MGCFLALALGLGAFFCVRRCLVLGGSLAASEEGCFRVDDLMALDAPWVTVELALVTVDFGSLPVLAGALLPLLFPSAFRPFSRVDLRPTVAMPSESDLVGGSLGDIGVAVPSESAMAGESTGGPTSTSFGICGCMLALWR